MANPQRRPGKHGARTPDPDRYLPVLEHYTRPWEGPLAAHLAVHPVDRETEVRDWPMYVNGPDPANPPAEPDGIGCCVWSGAAHAFSAMRVYAGYPEPEFAPQAVVDAYAAVAGYVPGDASTDNGTDPTEALKYLATAGLPDTDGTVHKVAAYAQFGNPRNTQLLAQVLDTFGTVWVTWDLPASAEQQFADHQPWTYVPGAPSAGGHLTVLQRRREGGTGVLEHITWGAVQKVTLGFNWRYITGAYAVASEDFIQASGATIKGLDLAQLIASTAQAE